MNLRQRIDQVEQELRDSFDKQAARRHRVPEGQCSYCDAERATQNQFHPPHDASYRCESGKHNHCSCDACF